MASEVPSGIIEQLDNAVVNLFDVLGNAVGKRDDQLQRSKNQALNLLKEAEQCSQLMHRLHDKADEERKRLYTCVAQGDMYSKTAGKVVKVLDTELEVLSGSYFDILKDALPILLAPTEYKHTIQSTCIESCKIPYESVLSILSNTFHQELSMTIGSCLLRAETKIISTVVESMVTRLNQLSTQIVEQLNIVKQAKIEDNVIEENQQEADIDENIAHAQRRFTYTERNKERVTSNEGISDKELTSSKENLCKPDIKPELSAKEIPGKLPKDKSMESVASLTESEKSSEKSVTPEVEEKIDEDDITSPPTEEVAPKEDEVEKEEVEEVTTEEVIEVVMEEEEMEEEKHEAEPDSPPKPKKKKPKKKEPKKEEPEKEEPEKEEPEKEEPEKEEPEKEEPEKEEPKVEEEEEEVKSAENGMATPIINEFDSLEETTALTHLTKARAKGPPKKKRRPPKNTRPASSDPFEYSVGVTNQNMDMSPSNGISAMNEDDEEEPLVKPDDTPKKKTVRMAGHPGGPMMPVMPMGELKGLFKSKNKKEKEEEDEQEEEMKTSEKEPESEVSPVKRKPFLGRPGPGMGGMGFPMGGGGGGNLMAQLKSKQKSRAKTPDPDSEETDKSNLKEVKSSPIPPPKPKPKPKGGVPLFPLAPKPDRAKSIGNKEKLEAPGSPRSNSMPAMASKSGKS